jgi:transcriptional regulator with XRE-family HTH domain
MYVARCDVLGFNARMGLRIGAGGLGGLLDLLGIRNVFVPGLDRDAEPIANCPPQRETGAPVVGEDSPAVGAVDVQHSGQVLDRPGVGALQCEGSAVHAMTVVPLGHGVKGARRRLLPVPRKTAETDREILKVIGSRFREARKEAGLTHQWLADKAGVERTGIGRFESGKRGLETSGFLAVMSVAAECGIDLRFVFTGTRGVAMPAGEAKLQELIGILTEPGVAEAVRSARAAGGRR